MAEKKPPKYNPDKILEGIKKYIERREADEQRYVEGILYPCIQQLLDAINKKLPAVLKEGKKTMPDDFNWDEIKLPVTFEHNMGTFGFRINGDPHYNMYLDDAAEEYECEDDVRGLFQRRLPELWQIFKIAAIVEDDFWCPIGKVHPTRRKKSKV